MRVRKLFHKQLRHFIIVLRIFLILFFDYLAASAQCAVVGAGHAVSRAKGAPASSLWFEVVAAIIRILVRPKSYAAKSGHCYFVGRRDREILL